MAIIIQGGSTVIGKRRGFSPEQIPDLEMWYDFSDETLTEFDGAGTFIQAYDKNDNSRTIVNAASVASDWFRTYDFYGGPQSLKTNRNGRIFCKTGFVYDFSNGCTFFGVHRATTTAFNKATYTLIGNGETGNGLFFGYKPNGTSNFIWRTGNTWDFRSFDPQSDVYKPTVFMEDMSTTNFGTEESFWLGTSFGGFYINRGAFAEVIGYNRSLTYDEKVRVFNYLCDKWNIVSEIIY